MSPDTGPNWGAIEVAYRAGKETLRAIAEAQGVSHVAIQKRAKKDGWVRDLSARIEERANYLVTKDAVTKTVTKERLVTERAVVEANAELTANIIRAERRDLAKARELVGKLFAEVDAQTSGTEVFEHLGEYLADPKANSGKLAEAYQRVLSLPARIKGAKDLVDALDKLIVREREVHRIGDTDGDDDPAERITQIVLVAVRPDHGVVIDQQIRGD